MIPQELLATATVPGQQHELQLYRHDKDYMFRVRGQELMSSREHGSEELLAELAFDRLRRRDELRILVGGLGMGYTLAKVLELAPADAVVEVVELVPEVVTWNREWLGELTGHPLQDPRVELHEGDVIRTIRGSESHYDMILIDVDNGPEGFVRDANHALYSHTGIKAFRNALRRDGVLSVWSSANHPWFTDRIRKNGFEVSEERVRARRVKGPRRTIWVGVRA